MNGKNIHKFLMTNKKNLWLSNSPHSGAKSIPGTAFSKRKALPRPLRRTNGWTCVKIVYIHIEARYRTMYDSTQCANGLSLILYCFRHRISLQAYDSSYSMSQVEWLHYTKSPTRKKWINPLHSAGHVHILFTIFWYYINDYTLNK